MHGDLTAVYQFCYLRWTSRRRRRGRGGVFSSESGGRRSRGTPAAKCLVKLFIDLGRKRYSQSCASSRAGEPFDEDDLSAQTVIPDTHHISSRPTRSPADTRRRGREGGGRVGGSTRTYYLIMQRSAAHMHAPSQITGMYLRQITPPYVMQSPGPAQ